MMRPLKGWTLKATKRVITDIRKSFKFSRGLDSISFIKIDGGEPELLMFHIKAKNGCGYRSCDVDHDIYVNPVTMEEVDLIEARLA